jgi:hypothetical protein
MPRMQPEAGEDAAIGPLIDPAKLAIRCSGEGPGPNRKSATKLVRAVLRRRKWSLHRHVHLVAAFDDARSRGPITSFLGAGSGAGISELYLAVRHPEISFVLTDYDESRVDEIQKTVDGWALANVVTRPLNLLEAPDAPGCDFVSSIEVLEHIEDDATAARNLQAWSNRFVYSLVPGCTDADLVDEPLRRRVWERHEHHRPGYTADTMRAVFADARMQWLRNCYFEPDAPALRRRLTEATDEELEAQRLELIEAAVADVRDEILPGGASGIEILVRVDPEDAPAPEPVARRRLDLRRLGRRRP